MKYTPSFILLYLSVVGAWSVRQSLRRVGRVGAHVLVVRVRRSAEVVVPKRPLHRRVLVAQPVVDAGMDGLRYRVPPPLAQALKRVPVAKKRGVKSAMRGGGQTRQRKEKSE
jgi:hypothetical protein